MWAGLPTRPRPVTTTIIGRGSGWSGRETAPQHEPIVTEPRRRDRHERAKKRWDGTPGTEKPDVLAVDSFDRPILNSLPAAKAGGPVNSREVDPVHWTRDLRGL